MPCIKSIHNRSMLTEGSTLPKENFRFHWNTLSIALQQLETTSDFVLRKPIQRTIAESFHPLWRDLCITSTFLIIFESLPPSPLLPLVDEKGFGFEWWHKSHARERQRALVVTVAIEHSCHGRESPSVASSKNTRKMTNDFCAVLFICCFGVVVFSPFFFLSLRVLAIYS